MMVAASAPREFHYRTRLASRSFVPGAHASRSAGSGLDVAALVPLERARDARRLDLRACLRDPFGGWWAREHHQRSAIAVLLLVDISASMPAGDAARARAASDFAQALARSALGRGDAFGVIAFDAAPRLALRPTRSRAAAAAALDDLGLAAFDGRGADGVLDAAALLPRSGALVFLLSDFCWPAALLDGALGRLQRHDLVPVWLDSPQALDALPHHGLLPLADAESGQQRLLWWRPALRRRWRALQAAHSAAVQAAFARHQRRALALDGAFDANAVSAYFAAR
jgi:uncharacterized protein (DUF58 family)